MPKTTLTRSLLSLVTLPAASACLAGSIDGQVDGDNVPALQSGIVFESDAMSDDDYDTIAIAAFYTFEDGCERASDQLDTKADSMHDAARGTAIDTVVDDVQDFEKDNLPDDYWAAYVVVGGDDERDLEDDFALDDDLSKVDAYVLVCHHTGAVDAPDEDPTAALLPEVLAPFAEDKNRDCYLAEDGDLHITEYTGERMKLSAELELVDDDEDDAGDVELSGIARECRAAGDAFDDAYEQFAALDQAASAPAGDDSCQYAFDGECDHPGVGTGACPDGTDVSDCGG